MHAHYQARHHYRAKPYSGKIVTLNAANKSDKVAKRLENVWLGLALGSLETYFVPGNHRTILDEPNIQVLVEQLNRLLCEVDRT